MSNVSPVVAKPTPGLTPEQARDIRARALRYALDCHIRKQQTTGSSSEKTTVTERGGQHDLTDDSTKKWTTRQEKKGKENADVHGDCLRAGTARSLHR